MSILEELEWRGLIADCTDKDQLSRRLAERPIILYAGFDPTADSLHVGNLVPLLTLRRFQHFGHHPMVVAGGATGLIGDPSGRTKERQLLTREEMDRRLACIKRQMAQLLDFEVRTNPARMVDNATWTAAVPYLDFLRDIGKHFSVNMMVSKESVRARMEDRESGISYTEFSYMLLQAFDFFHLRDKYDCELQIGGSDQWGNITAGIDLARKKLGAHLFGLTLPLITNSDGTKFGKSVAGAVWLDPKQTSPYRFYQFWIRTDDRDVIRFLKTFTIFSSSKIQELEGEHAARPEARAAHKELAWELTQLIHGPTATADAIRASEILFGGGLEGVSESTFMDVVGEVPSGKIEKPRFDGEGTMLVDLLALSGLCASKGQARKDLEGGGIYVNNVREGNVRRAISANDLLFGKYLLLRKGKRNYFVLHAEIQG